MSEIKLSQDQAYLAMYAFLENYYSLTNSDDIGGLLGELSLLPDGSSADPAVKDDWDESIKKAIYGKVDASLILKNT